MSVQDEEGDGCEEDEIDESEGAADDREEGGGRGDVAGEEGRR